MKSWKWPPLRQPDFNLTVHVLAGQLYKYLSGPCERAKLGRQPD